MQHPEHPDLAQMVANFNVGPATGPVEPLGKGLINDTFRVVTAKGAFVLQRINPLVFPDPECIMANLMALVEHASRKSGSGLRVPSLVRSADGAPYVRASDGAVWRLMELIPDGVNLARIERPHEARAVGCTLGRFHRLTQDLATEQLGYSFPGFHRTPDYLARHLAARVHATQTAGVVSDDERATLQTCFDFIDSRRGLARILEQALEAGWIRERITHGDPKLDNFLFHREYGHALALIDLDTVQPGLIQHDLGDCLRSCCNQVGESPKEGVAVTFDLGLCGDILDAYATETRDFLDPGDVAVLYDSIRLMPFELALRFLTDHLEGDRYFRIAFRGQNLHKARIQLALVSDIEAKEDAIRVMIATVFPDHAVAV